MSVAINSRVPPLSVTQRLAAYGVREPCSRFHPGSHASVEGGERHTPSMARLFKAAAWLPHSKASAARRRGNWPSGSVAIGTQRLWIWGIAVSIVLCAATALPTPSNGTVFSASINVPNLIARNVFPMPSDILDPLAAARVTHWRCRYENDRLVEVARRDTDRTLRPMQPTCGDPPEHGFLFRYPSPSARKPSLIVTPTDGECHVAYDDEGFLGGLQFSPGLCGQSCTSLRLKRRGGKIARASYWTEDMPACDWYGVHAREYTYDGRGFLVDVRYVDTAGKPCNSALGIARRSYVRGRRGEWDEVAFWTAAGTRTADWHGVARYVLACNAEGQFTSAELYGTDGAPTTNLLGAWRIEWQYAQDSLVGSRAYAPGTNIVFDGPPLMPDLFQRTWADAVVVREKEEIGLPIWRFVDYAELGHAYERCQSRLNSSTPFKPYYGEQMRVLAEYLCLARAGHMSLCAVYDAHAVGIADPRWCALALLPAGIAPHPSSDAALFVTRTLRAAMPERALLFTSCEETLGLMAWDAMMRNVATGIVVLDQASLGDLATMNACRARYGGGAWLPSSADVHAALQEYAQSLDAQGQSLTSAFSLKIESDRVQFRGREGVTRINLALLERTLATNRPLRAFCEDLTRGSSLISNLVPTGPLFEFSDHGMTDADAYRAVAFWAALEREMAGKPVSDDWHAARRLMSRHAATQARLFFLCGRTNDAACIYAHAHALCPDDPTAYLVRAADMLECGDFECARIEIAAASAHAHAGADLAELQHRCDALCRRAAEIATLEAIPNRHPTNTLRLAQLHKLQGNAGRACTLATALMPPATNDIAMLDELASLFIALDKLDCAEACLACRTQAAPDDFVGWTSRAVVAFSQRKAEDGIAFLRRAAALDRPRLRRVLDHNTLVRILEAQGRTNLVQEVDLMVAQPRVPAR